MAEIIESQPELPLVGTPTTTPSTVGNGETPPWLEADPVTTEDAPSTETGAQDNEEQATSVESETDKPTVEEAPDPAKEAKRQQRRLERKTDRLLKDRAEQRTRAEAAERRLAELERPAAPEGMPTLEQFDYDTDKYAEAVTQFARQQAATETQSRTQQESAKQNRANLISKWEEKVEAVSDKYEDFSQKVGELEPGIPFVAAMMEAENGPDIAYYFANNPEEADRIIQLPILAQIREIGKLEATLAAKPPAVKKPSQAPTPITPVTGTATPVASEPSENDDMKTWIKKRNQQIAAARH